MTNAEIIQMATEAAHHALAAHDARELPCADTAYDFTRQFRYEEFDGDDAAAREFFDSMELSEQDWILFRQIYRSTVAEGAVQ
jgi:hypothetical protein